MELNALKRSRINLIHLDGLPILDQLRIEEALLRVDSENWCLLNRGIQNPAIVMGISGKEELHINNHIYKQKPISLIRRFTGGGTVVVDHNTYFVTWIFNSIEIQVPCFPNKVFDWSGSFYQKVFNDIPFAIRENDYVINQHKCGGNAQYMRKERWLHHTSFLWDYDEANMDYLTIPPKIPKYREKRSHVDFLCRLKDYFECRDAFEEKILKNLSNNFCVKERSLENIGQILQQPHRQATILY